MIFFFNYDLYYITFRHFICFKYKFKTEWFGGTPSHFHVWSYKKYDCSLSVSYPNPTHEAIRLAKIDFKQNLKQGFWSFSPKKNREKYKADNPTYFNN